MERLTNKNPCDTCTVDRQIGNPYRCECDRCSKPGEWKNECLKKLKQYEDLEEQGLLLKIPCKVGDTLYLPVDITNEIVVGICSGFTTDAYRCRGMLVQITYEKNEKCWEAFSDFGKTVFLTQAEAEEALKKMESKGVENGNNRKTLFSMQSFAEFKQR